jgi:hypothetical protein
VDANENAYSLDPIFEVRIPLFIYFKRKIPWSTNSWEILLVQILGND